MSRWQQFIGEIDSISQKIKSPTKVARKIDKQNGLSLSEKEIKSFAKYIGQRVRIKELLDSKDESDKIDEIKSNHISDFPPPEKDEIKRTKSENGEEINYTGSTCITSLEDAVEFFNIDLDKWKVIKWTANSWDVTLKNADKQPVKRTNYQVKLILEPITVSMNILADKIIRKMTHYSPKYPKVKRKQPKDPHCLLFDPSDIHIGKIASSFETGEDYNSQIAVQRVKHGLKGLLDQSAGYNFDKVIFIMGNDILHVDTPRNTTTSGTPQDTDGMWYDSFMIAHKLLVDIVETLIQIAPVEIVFNPSNHDYMSGFFMSQSLDAWFKDSKDVTFNNDMSHRKYTTYGKNLIGTTHFDGAKPNDLPRLMAEEAPKEWADCPHRYIFGHHVHHKSSKDHGSVNIETLRSPSGTDSWHHRQGYQHAPKAVEAFIFHPEYGQVARLMHIF